LERRAIEKTRNKPTGKILIKRNDKDDEESPNNSAFKVRFG